MFLENFKKWFVNDNSILYRNNNILLKLIINNKNNDLLKILNYFKNNQLVHFCKISEIFLTDDVLKGYTMPYIRNTKNGIEDFSIAYLYENYKEIYNEIIKISENNILIDDLEAGNVLYDSMNIYIIDFDEYAIKDNVLISNINSLNALFIDILIKLYFQKFGCSPDNDTINFYHRVFNINNSPEKVKEMLSKYTYIIDFINDKQMCR